MLMPLLEIPEEFFLSCRNFQIDDDTARILAEQFREEFMRFPTSLNEALEVLE